MPAPTLRQTAGNSCGSGQSRSVTVTLTQPTIEKNLIVIFAVSTHGDANMTAPAGYTLIRDKSQGDLRCAMWYRESAPATSSVTITTNRDRSVQVRVMEYAGASQSGSLDQITVITSQDNRPRTGITGTIAQADSIVVAGIANHYASTVQSGFSGALTRLIETVSPQQWGFGRSDSDDLRSRLTVHHCITNSVAQFFLECLLSSTRHWIAILVVFKGGSLGPARMSSTVTATTNELTTAGSGSLTAFGPLASVNLSTTGASPMLVTDGVQARIGPFNYQYRLGGWTGLLIGASTDYRVDETDGLEGWELRTSDDDLPRGDGSLRGVDLQAARQVLFKLGAEGTEEQIEQAMDILFRALVPQRDSDWELIWRHPGRPLRMMRARPINLQRELTPQQAVNPDQEFVVRAADPRHYSAFVRQATIPNTIGSATPIPTGVLNEGNGFAYPTIRIAGPTSGPPVTRVQLTNSSNDVAFVVEAVLPTGSTLQGDMEARATGAPRSVVTIDDQSKYGAWQHPRDTWRLDPGNNAVFLQTVPAGAPVTCVLTYRDTWSG